MKFYKGYAHSTAYTLDRCHSGNTCTAVGPIYSNCTILFMFFFLFVCVCVETVLNINDYLTNIQQTCNVSTTNPQPFTYWSLGFPSQTH